MTIMTIIGSISLTSWLIIALVISLIITGAALNWVSKSVGIKFAMMLFRMKRFGKNKILLRVLVPTGVPEWRIVDIARMIEYQYKENGRDKQGMVMYDYKCLYTMFAGFKVLDCRPDDVLPVNPYATTSLSISGEVFKKNAVDSANQDFDGQKIKAWLKYAVPILAVAIIGIIFYSQNQADSLKVCTDTVISLSRQIASAVPANIIAS